MLVILNYIRLLKKQDPNWTRHLPTSASALVLLGSAVGYTEVDPPVNFGECYIKKLKEKTRWILNVEPLTGFSNRAPKKRGRPKRSSDDAAKGT